MNAEPNPHVSARTLDETLDERIETAVALAWGRHGYMTDEGEMDTHAPIKKLADLVSTRAVAESKADRAKVCITRREAMNHVFEHVPGPEDWAQQEDPELAEGVYKSLDTYLWRLTAIGPSGPIQMRLNGDQGLVLLRTKVNPHKTDAFYATRDLGCLLEDAYKQLRAAEKRRADRDAAFTAMLIERVPEHGKRFNRELVGGLTTALNSAKAITAGVLAAVEDDDAEDE